MGCGCGGGGKRNIRIRTQATDKRKTCPTCRGIMIYKQQYSPRQRRYIKLWECTKCKKKSPAK